MKVFGFLFSVIIALDSTMLMLMMNQNKIQNSNQANQLSKIWLAWKKSSEARNLLDIFFKIKTSMAGN